MLTRYFFAAVVVSTIPYILQEEIVRQLNYRLLFLPFLGLLIALAAVWLYTAEYVRAQVMNRQFMELLSDRYLKERGQGSIEKLFWKPIGWVTTIVLASASVIITFINELL